MKSARLLVSATLVALGVALPGTAAAQAFGIGPHFSFVRGDLPSGTPATRFFGGTIRMASSKHVALEVSLDYRKQVAEDGSAQVRETPLHGSLLLFPVRAAFSPYLTGGLGIYTRKTDTLGPIGEIETTVSEREMGWHLGGGAEIFVTKKAAIFLDYRFTFVKFGDPEDGSDPINIPGASVIPGLDKVKFSHRGSMWKSGIAFYF